MGKIRHYEKEYEGKYEAIIEEEKWKKAQELIRNQPYRKAKYEEALLRGIIKYNAPHKLDQKKMVDPSRKVKG